MPRNLPIPVWKPHKSFHPLDTVSGRSNDQMVVVEANPADFKAVSYHSRILYVQPKKDVGYKAGEGYDTTLNLVDVKTLVFKVQKPGGITQYCKLDVPSFIKNVLKIPFGGDREPVSVAEHLSDMPSWEVASIASQQDRNKLDPQKTTSYKNHPIGTDWHFSAAHVVEDRLVPFQDTRNAALMKKGIKPLGPLHEGTKHDDLIGSELGATIRAGGGDDVIRLHSFKEFWKWKEINTRINGGAGEDTLELYEVSGLLEVARSKSGKCFLIKERFHLSNAQEGNSEALYSYKLYNVEKLVIHNAKNQAYEYELAKIGAGEKKFFEDGKWYIPDSSARLTLAVDKDTNNSDQTICAPEMLDPMTGQ